MSESQSAVADNTSNGKKALRYGGTAIAGFAVAAAIFAPTSLAAWQSQDTIAGKQIQSGNLQVATISSQAQDVSPDMPDSPHNIDVTTWKAVPGDVVQITSDIDVALEGDNLKAVLDTSGAQSIVPAEASQYVTTSTVLQKSDGTVISPDAEGNYNLKAGRAGQADGVGPQDAGLTEVGATLDGQSDVKAVTTVNFSKDTPDRVLTQANLTQDGDGIVTLKQVR